MRITTNAILRNYKSNLGATISNLNTSRTHVMTNRSFNSVAEDPASAARASQLWRKYHKTQDNLDMLKDAQSRQDSQEDALMQVSTTLSLIAEKYNVEAMNATNQDPESRQSYASALRQYQKSMVSSLNSTYEDTFLFAGSDGKNPPFSLSEGGVLTYRNTPVDADTEPYKSELEKMTKENIFVDLGMGLSLDDTGSVIPSSAFDLSLPGINAVGYGKDSDGMSNNAIVLTGQLADLLEAKDFDSAAYGKLMNKFKTVNTGVLNQVTELGVKTQYLTATNDRLESADISIQEQLQKVEGIDMAEAITDYSWNQYAYNAALKVGTSILSASFIDFMK